MAKHYCIPLFLLFNLITIISGKAQTALNGKVVDAKTEKPLAFVNLLADETKRGAISDIDGKFSLKITGDEKSLVVTYVGYQPIKLSIDSLLRLNKIVIKLNSKGYELNEVIIKAGENPAFRIIKAVSENKQKNSPEALNSYRYTTYNKFVFKLDTTNLNIRNEKKREKELSRVEKENSKPKKQKSNETSAESDSLREDLTAIMAEQHIFITETVSEKKFLKPISNERIIATRTSGVRNSLFSLLSSQLQSFSFYNDYFELLEIRYLNPIAPGSLWRYNYRLEDSTYQGKDTIYQISFAPRNNKAFKGLKGTIYINTDGYAIQNVIAEPADQDEELALIFEQQYEKVGKNWFPTQLNTEMLFKSIDIEGFSIKAVGHTYLTNIKINPEFSKKDIDLNGVEIVETDLEVAKIILDKERTVALDQLELNTYRILDSLGEKHNFTRKLAILDMLTHGYIGVGFLNIELRELFRYNDYERARVGLSLSTNNKLSKLFSVGAYGAYGFGDRSFKYGGHTKVFFNKRQSVYWQFKYQNDLLEIGQTSFMPSVGLINPDNIRQLYATQFDRMETFRTSLHINNIKYLQTEFALFQSERNIANRRNEEFINEISDSDIGSRNNLTIVGYNLKLRYAYGEKSIRSSRGIISVGTKFPVFHLNIEQGLPNFLNSNQAYLKVELKAEKSFTIRHLGRLNIQLNAAKINNAVPENLLYYAGGTFQKPWVVFAPRSFQTFWPTDILMNEFYTIDIAHNFGRIVPSNLFPIELLLINKMMWGNLSSSDIKQVYNPRNGIYEAGLAFDNIIRSNFSGLGVGVFHRYGPTLTGFGKENFAVRLYSTWRF